MHVITRVRFELPVAFDSRILIALCCDDIVWEDRRVLSGSIHGVTGTARLGGVLGERCFYGSFTGGEGKSPRRLIDAIQRRLDWVCESRLCQGRTRPAPHRAAA